MPISDLTLKYSEKELRRGPDTKNKKLINKFYGKEHDPHTDYFYGFLALIYDGINKIDAIKAKMRLFFISSTQHLVVGDEDVEEYMQTAKRKNLIDIAQDGTIMLTEDGKKLAEFCYHINCHTTYWMQIIFSEKTVMFISALILIILSILKIITGLQLSSQGMLTEGFENLTDLIKIAIILFIGIKLNKDKTASIIILLLMMFTGVTLIWSGMDALLNPTPIIPTIQAYLIGFFSIFLNVALMFLKSIVGRASGNLSLLSDSKDSGLNVRISIGVLIGLTFAIFKFYFVDALVGIVIGIFIFKEGIEILREISSKEEEFDITAINVLADHIYNSRLTGYILASIRREELTKMELIQNFKEGLELGRLYYQGFADFFYDNLGTEIIEKHVDKLIKWKLMDILNDKLILTSKGLKYFYKAKAKEYNSRVKTINEGTTFRRGPIYCILFIIILALLILFANDINEVLISF